jgi:hypothetical protein
LSLRFLSSTFHHRTFFITITAFHHRISSPHLTMPFPASRVVLETLAFVDLLATLALAETSSSLRNLILNQVVGKSMITRFLRENQYSLYHDNHGKHFSNKEIALIHQAFAVVQSRHGLTLYDETAGFLGALIAQTLFTIFQKHVQPGINFTITSPEVRKN